MKLSAKILLLMLTPFLANAQTQQTQLDSLQSTLKNAANDTVRMYAYRSIAGYYAEINRDSSLLYSAQSLSIAQKLKLKFTEANILIDRGFVLTNIGNYPEALESFYQALKIAEDPASQKSILNLPDGQSAQTARLNLLSRIHLNMGHLYGATGNNYKKISEYFIAIEFSESVQSNYGIFDANMNLGNGYLKLNKLDSALLFEQRAINMISSGTLGNRRGYLGYAFQLLGQIYQAKGDFELSRDAYQKSIGLFKEQNNLASLARAYNFFGSLYENFKNPDSGLVYARKALETAKMVRLPLEVKNAYKLFSDIYSDQKNQKNKDSTLTYLKLYTALNDSLNKVEKQNLLAYQNIGFDEQLRLKKLEEEKIQTQTKVRTNSMLAGLVVFFIIGLILYRNYRHKQKVNEILESTLSNLKSTQSQLIQSEKMASLGELTAGIAHEIQNPLNFVNNFSEINTELVDELKSELVKGSMQTAIEIADNLKENEQKINHHGKRAGAIVKNMLQHSSSHTGKMELTDINKLADEYFRLAYHGLRAKDKSFNATVKTDFDKSIGNVNIIPQDIGRAILNLITNAFYAVDEKKNASAIPIAIGTAGQHYEPTVSVSTKKNNGKIEIKVSDNGNGISPKVLDKIFQPFFTTKPTGQGTGLGLSLSYDIVKAQGGEIKVETREGEGSEFIIQLPGN